MRESAELLQESNEEWTAALGYVPSGGRPDQFGYSQDYPYARSLGFSDQDIRFYLEGYFSKLLGKRIGGIMKLKLEDPDFGPLPSWIQGRAGAGLFDCENDYPYALSLGYNDRDISEMAKNKPEVRAQYAAYKEQKQKYENILDLEKRPKTLGELFK